MAIFKKSGLQGNYILSNGVQVLFDKQGYYETDKEDVISQLAPVYEQVEKREDPVVQEKPKAVASKTGAISSATLAATAKANS